MGSEQYIDHTKRRIWLRALRRFKFGIKVRAKLGVLQSICEEVAAERRIRQWDAPLWEDDAWTTFLYTCIKDSQFPPELLAGFVKTAEVTFMNRRQQPTVESVLEVVDLVCKQQSRQLRQKFGVFDGQQQEAAKEVQATTSA